MPKREITPEAAGVNKIRSCLATLDNYRRTSMALHGGLKESVYAVASEQQILVDAVRSEFRNSPDIGRWYNKFNDYVKQYNLL